jgi:hypothetical protein
MKGSTVFGKAIVVGYSDVEGVDAISTVEIGGKEVYSLSRFEDSWINSVPRLLDNFEAKMKAVGGATGLIIAKALIASTMTLRRLRVVPLKTISIRIVDYFKKYVEANEKDSAFAALGRDETISAQ